MHIKLQTQKAKRMKKLRSSTVEPVLGNWLTAVLAFINVEPVTEAD
jgi:hypothetical protein